MTGDRRRSWLGAASRQAWVEQLRDAYQARIVDVRIEGRFLATIAYLLSFIVTRGWTLRGAITGDKRHMSVGDTHVHHMVPGLVVVGISGLLALDANGPESSGSQRRGAAVLFGAGAALVVDEFCLIWFLEDTYWQQRGVDVTLVAYGLLGATLATNLYVGRRLYKPVVKGAIRAVQHAR